MLEAVRTVEHKRGRYAEITLNTCAYAGTGNVLKVRDEDPAKKLLISLHLSISLFDRSLTFFPSFLRFFSSPMLSSLIKVQEMLRICAEHLTDDAEHQSVAVLGIALVVLGEDVGTEVRGIIFYSRRGII